MYGIYRICHTGSSQLVGKNQKLSQYTIINPPPLPVKLYTKYMYCCHSKKTMRKICSHRNFTPFNTGLMWLTCKRCFFCKSSYVDFTAATLSSCRCSTILLTGRVHSSCFLVKTHSVDKEKHTGVDWVKHSKAVFGKYFIWLPEALFSGLAEALD